MVNEDLNEETFLHLCTKYYRNKRCCTTEEFLDDLQRIKYIKKLITRYLTKGQIEERLILNHLIVLNNLFGPQFLNRIIFLKLFAYIKHLKPFLLYLNILPDNVYYVKGRNYSTLEIEMDWFIVDKLRNISKTS